MIREKLPIIFSCFLISFVTGESCWNSFQNILETRQIPGRLDKDQRWLSKQFMVSKMECLDICLRTTRCASFYLKQRIKNWICIILDKTPWESDKLVRQNTGWMNFNASSQKLQEVGSHKYQTLHYQTACIFDFLAGHKSLLFDCELFRQEFFFKQTALRRVLSFKGAALLVFLFIMIMRMNGMENVDKSFHLQIQK